MARLAHKMAIASEKVTADVVEATEFPDLVQLYRVSGVPKTVVNGQVEFVGGQPERRFMEEVIRAVPHSSTTAGRGTGSGVADLDPIIAECLAQRVWAVVGASRDPERYGYKVFTALVAAGYRAYPVNPKAPEVAGHLAYPSLAALPDLPGVVNTVVPPATTRRVVEEAAALGIELVWMQPGSESDEAIALADAKGIRVVHHACAMLAATRGVGSARDYASEA